MTSWDHEQLARTLPSSTQSPPCARAQSTMMTTRPPYPSSTQVPQIPDLMLMADIQETSYETKAPLLRNSLK